MRKAQKKNSLPSAEILFLCGLITHASTISPRVKKGGGGLCLLSNCLKFIFHFPLYFRELFSDLNAIITIRVDHQITDQEEVRDSLGRV